MAETRADASREAPDVTTTPVMVVTRTFAARPSAWPEVREFLVATLAQVDPLQAASPEVQRAVGDALLGSAGSPAGTFQISVRITPDSVEVEVLRDVPPQGGPLPAGPGQPASFAAWFSDLLARDGLSQAQAARQLGVSVRTVGRWVHGETEPRMRQMRRVTETFGN
jgi:DNA-binding XRE family transcriptional regulator